jgi:PKD repeat protein
VASVSYPIAGAKTPTLLVDGLPYTYADFVLIARSSPLPQISASSITACVGTPITFSTSVLADGYEWSFPGGTPATASIQNPPPVAYAAPGQYWVKLRLQTTCCGFSPWDSVAVYIVGTPTVSLPADTLRCAGDPPLTLQVSAFPGASITWYFGGNVVATGVSTLQASSAGQYVVSVSYPGGCEGRDTFNLSVVPAIPVSLGPDIQLCAGDPPPVLDAGFPGNQYLWTLNGVPIATTQTLTASQSGVYAVLVSNPYGCLGRDTLQVTYTSFSINLGPDQELCGGAVTLDAGLNATTCQWSLNGNPLPTTACQITATASGTYSVVAQNSVGCIATDQVQVVLGAPITAQFSAPTSVQVGQPAQFTDQSTPTPTAWTWNFGDGSPPLSGNPASTHIYTTAGLYPVVLAVGNGLCTDTALRLVEALWDCATLPLQANFTASPNPVDLGVGGGTVYFTNTSTGATTYLWLFGTGDTSTAFSPSYAYTQPGIYTVTLIATNYNCRDTLSQTLTVVRAEPTNPSSLLGGSSGTIAFYPNPAVEQVFLRVPPPPQASLWRAALCDAVGKVVREWHFSQEGVYPLSLQGLASGYYILQVSDTGGAVFRGRLLKE